MTTINLPVTCRQLKIAVSVLGPSILISGMLLSDFFAMSPAPLTVFLVGGGFVMTYLFWMFSDTCLGY